MKLLLLGGPRFLGYAIIEAALSGGHDITTFNRGRTNPELFPDVEKLVGDRDGGLEVLGSRRWDAVIDTCGYVPRVVRNSVRKLKDSVDHYTFISSISVYENPLPAPYDETCPVVRIEDETVEEITGETYGALKVLCEETVAAELPGRALNVRPGLIVGPRDPTDRFTYWLDRLARGGSVLAPGVPEDPCQVIDVRDLAEWLVLLAENRVTGLYNATGPVTPLGEVLAVCTPPGSEPEITWTSDEFLLEQGIQPWIGIPLWLTGDDKDTLRVSIAAAEAEGLVFRPLKETAADTLSWARTRPADYGWRAGLSPEKESELLAAWARKGHA